MPVAFTEPMDSSPRTAWQPVTPQGVAAFAHARLRRLLLVQSIVALLVGASVACFIYEGYFPIITTAIEQLPGSGEIRDGRLAWNGETPAILADGRFLALSVDMEHAGRQRSVAHLHFEFGRTNVFIHSLLGYAVVDYPPGWIITANRTELKPLWGAWRPPILALTIIGVIVYLMMNWFFLATLYAGPIWLLGFYLNRDLDWRRSWRFCGAALLPGALLLLVAISFYVLGVMDLVQLGFIFVAHIVLGWVYLLVGIFFVPRVPDTMTPANPFTPQNSKQGG